MNVIKSAIVGCGRIAGDFEDILTVAKPCTHAGAYASNERVELDHVFDGDNDVASVFAGRWKASVARSIDELMLYEPVIVSVCTPCETHRDVVAELLRSNSGSLKVIWCEKPIASSLADADEMIEGCDAAGVSLVVNHNRRWDPYYAWLRKHIASGTLGDIENFYAWAPLGLMNSGSHLFDAVSYLLGSSVSAVDCIEMHHDASTDPGGYVDIVFESGAKGYADCIRRCDETIFGIDVFGIRGDARIKEDGTGVVECAINTIDDDDEIVCELHDMQSRMAAALSDIILHIDDGQRLHSTGRDARAALEVAIASHLSVSVGSKLVIDETRALGSCKHSCIHLPIMDPVARSARLISRQTSFTDDGLVRR